MIFVDFSIPRIQFCLSGLRTVDAIFHLSFLDKTGGKAANKAETAARCSHQNVNCSGDPEGKPI